MLQNQLATQSDGLIQWELSMNGPVQPMRRAYAIYPSSVAQSFLHTSTFHFLLSYSGKSRKTFRLIRQLWDWDVHLKKWIKRWPRALPKSLLYLSQASYRPLEMNRRGQHLVKLTWSNHLDSQLHPQVGIKWRHIKVTPRQLCFYLA